MILFKKKIENCQNTLGQVKEFLALQKKQISLSANNAKNGIKRKIIFVKK